MFDVILIGCGITGAATAYELSKYRLSVAVLERENDVACGATKANSAILHAGYDPEPGSLMARCNVRGAALARELCRKLDVPYRPTGSLVIAFHAGEPAQWSSRPGAAGRLHRPRPGAQPEPPGHRRAPCPHRRHLLPLGILPGPGRDRRTQRSPGPSELRRHRHPAGGWRLAAGDRLR